MLKILANSKGNKIHINLMQGYTSLNPLKSMFLDQSGILTVSRNYRCNSKSANKTMNY